MIQWRRVAVRRKDFFSGGVRQQPKRNLGEKPTAVGTVSTKETVEAAWAVG